MTHYAWLRWHGAFGAYCGKPAHHVTWNWNLVECPGCHTLRAHDEALMAEAS